MAKRLNGPVMFRKRTNVNDRFRVRVPGLFCVYCGVYADTDEHFPPVSHSVRGFVLPCCHECNVIAGSAHGTDFKKRALHVKRKLRSRYAKFLRVPIWSADELDEMGYDMKRDIRICQDKKRIVQSRLVWSAEGYLASIGQGKDFVLTNAEWDTTTE